MTLRPYSRIVLDVSALAASALPPELQIKTLRTAVHAGVRWISCPNPDAQRLAGRALFDLPQWRAIAPLGAEEGLDAIYGACLRLRRNRIDLIVLPDVQCRAARIVREAAQNGMTAGAAVRASDGTALMSALRYSPTACIFLDDTFDATAWRDPSVPAAILAKRGVDAFASPVHAGTPGVSGVIHAPDSPRALFRLFRDYRARHPSPQPGLAEAA
jgi:hypothetical protein